jgi:hypothetical protein
MHDVGMHVFEFGAGQGLVAVMFESEALGADQGAIGPTPA